MSVEIRGFTGVKANVDPQGQLNVVLPDSQIVNIPDSQRVIARQEFTEIIRGQVPGSSFHSLNGYNGAISTTYEPISSTSLPNFPVINNPITLSVSSDAVTDVYGSGTGAWTVYIDGVGANFVKQSEVINLNGRNAVYTSVTYLAINTFLVVAAGSNGSNNGTIYIGFGTVTTGGLPANIVNTIVIGENMSHSAIFTVPAGQNYIIPVFAFSSSGQGTAQMRARTNLGITYIDATFPLNAECVTLNSTTPRLIPEKTQMQIFAKSTTGNIALTVIVQGVLYDIA